MIEIWKDIHGYEKKYQVSNEGRIRSLRYNGGNHIKEMVPNDNGHGYLSVALCDGGGKRRLCYVHRLVADAFLPNPNNLPQINHIDHDRKNNKADNLEWCSIRYNLMYGTTHTSSIETLRKTHPSRKAIAQYDLCGKLIRVFMSQKDVEREIGISASSVSSCCHGRIKQTGGYRFAFVNEEGL